MAWKLIFNKNIKIDRSLLENEKKTKAKVSVLISDRERVKEKEHEEDRKVISYWKHRLHNQIWSPQADIKIYFYFDW